MDVPTPRLIVTGNTRQADAAVLVLHGGRGRAAPIRPTALSALRMVPIATRIVHSGRGRLAVVRVLNSQRGWNPADRSPLADVRWALEETRRRFGDGVPVGLVGHSLGGSAALAAAADRSVRSVVALAPWLSGKESPTSLAGKQVLIVHGSADRVTSAARSAAYARAARDVAAQVSFVDVPGGEHTMLRHLGVFDALAAGFVTGTLLGLEPAVGTEPLADTAFRAGASPGVATLIRRALHGESPLSV